MGRDANMASTSAGMAFVQRGGRQKHLHAEAIPGYPIDCQAGVRLRLGLIRDCLSSARRSVLHQYL